MGKEKRVRRPAPPVRHGKSTTIAETRWEAFSLPGIDVRLFRATYLNAEGEEMLRPGVPKVDPNYVWRPEMVREFAWAAFPHDQDDPVSNDQWTPQILTGPKGCGKTSFVVQMAAQCNVAIFRINLNVGTSVRHLKGRMGAMDGRTVFVPGVTTMAMEQGGWLILDEISGATPPVALCLFPILEPDGAVLLEDAQPPRYVRRSPFFRVFATDNVIGAAREEDRFSYAGTNPDVNDALMDRFGSMISVEYMDKAQEHALISAKVPGIDSDDLEGLIRVANSVRESREISGGFSIRMLIDWCRRLAAGVIDANGNAEKIEVERMILDAAYPAFLHKMRSRVEQRAVIEVIHRIFDLYVPETRASILDTKNDY